MKKIKYYIGIIAFASIITPALLSCEDPDYIAANPDAGATQTTLSANFAFANAAPGATSLDLYVNNQKIGNSIVFGSGQTYSNVKIASNGIIANTSLRAKATTGTIGGVLGSNDIVFRAGNNNTNNLIASDSAFYTIIAVDSITRPRPVRKLDQAFFADTTFVLKTTGEQIGVVEWRALAPLVADRNKKVDAIGIVPLGSSDPGGSRFLVITDQLPLPSTTRFPKPAAGKCAIRFIMASPNVGSASVSLSVGGTAITQGITSNQFAFPGFNPSVGSRAVTNNTYNTTVNSTPAAHDVVVTQSGVELARINGVAFDDKGVYTIVLSGNRRTLPMSLSIIKNK